ncbi:type 4a pilus biogenesis protein PilO [Candidatus Berkelbacteria bacterium]|nr:type 4a pilus biogenesis protein PilO [Candidatus Berkelbacteria bacterium]MBI2588401.1 type 4a pilus biogenesis protein PilO [Candidatus Berkelbacteria bacterium]MBI4029637.1 type 4a pilus biogenesis protein PilO [Candidatus Berkelbacteria bacterium]
MREFLKNYASFLLLAAALLLIYFGLKPVLAGLKERSLELAVVQKEVENKKQKLETLTSLAGEIKSKSDLLAKVNTALPSEPDYPSLLVMLESIASQSNVLLQSLQPGQAAGNEAPLDITVQGNFSALKTFLSNLEQNSRPLLVKSINIVADATGDLLSATLRIGAAYNAGKTDGGATAPPSVKSTPDKSGSKEEE